MSRTRFAVPVLAAVAMLIATAGTAAAAPPTQTPTVRYHDAATTAAQTRHALDYWTPERIRNARSRDVVSDATPTTAAQPPAAHGPATSVAPFASPDSGAAGGMQPMVGGSRWGGAGNVLPAKDIGRLFYTAPDGSGWSCSASVIVADNRDLLLTAGHCVYDKSYVARYGTGWMGNYVFMPGYNAGTSPYCPGASCQWSGRGALTLSPWLDSRDFAYDIGMVVLGTNSAGSHIDDALGNAFGVTWNQPRGRSYADFGYPADPAPKYDGQHLIWCSGDASAGDLSPATQKIGCDMGHGASGGPWLMNFTVSAGWGYANSVNSRFDGTSYYGPYFGDSFGSLWNYAKTA